MNREFLCLTRKELFYAAAMLGLRRLVNVIYEFPADTAAFDREMGEARGTLRKKKLLTESARSGANLDFAVCACAAFCASPENCEVVDKNGYYATVYQAADVYMLMEKRSEDDLAAAWFVEKENLDSYIDAQIQAVAEETKQEGAGENGGA